jgi:tartrate dehydratase beta subunit/fumarate hydratase class I family protein
VSRARKLKKASKYHEYEVTDRYGDVVIWGGGFYSARDARKNRMFDKQYVRDPYSSWR